jgi:putative Mg2+ transporter-C (MgtC) family protein
MRFLTTFQTLDFLDTLFSLTVAFVLGMLIGAERQYRLRNAGLRTNVLVAVAAAAFVDLAMHLKATDGAVQVIAYVVSGIGFLGAGVIMKEGMNVRGLNTAATLWSSAAVGCCAGADMAAQAVALTAFVIAGNTLLRPLVNAINRSPLDEQSSEATYSVRLTADSAVSDRMRDHLVERLEAAHYPVAEVAVDTPEHSDDKVEIVATLVSTAVVAKELDAVVAELQKRQGVVYATWESSTKD